jgi:hypothetical protein
LPSALVDNRRRDALDIARADRLPTGGSIACATQKVHIARVAIRYNRSATNVLAAI